MAENRRLKVSCKTCASENQRDFPAELTVCFDSLQTTLNNTDPVEISHRILVCLECGFSEFVIPQAALLLLKQAQAAEGAVGYKTLKAIL
jgi:hypothetical protein